MPIAFFDEEPDKIEVKPLIETSCYRSYQAWAKEGTKVLKELPREITTQLLRETRFFAAVDVNKAPIKRQITRMVRRKGEDGKEYLTYVERWDGVDWVGRKIKKPVTERIEGVIVKPNMQPLIDEKGQRVGKQLEDQKTIYQYEIPYEGKKTIDKLIEETGSDPDRITYTVRTSNRRDNTVNYDQFVKNDWVQSNNIMMQDGGFELDYVDGLKKDKDNKPPKP